VVTMFAFKMSVRIFARKAERASACSGRPVCSGVYLRLTFVVFCVRVAGVMLQFSTVWPAKVFACCLEK
jgi:hypothetical protein